MRFLEAKLGLSGIVWIFICCYLLVDSLDGFMVQQLGISLRLSQLYKSTLFLLAVLALLKWRSATLPYLMIGMLLMLAGPFTRLLTEPQSTFFTIDLTLVIRVMLLLTIAMFCIESGKREPQSALKWGKRSLWLGFWVVSVNVLLGFAGIGFHTYPSTEVGFKGFFQAGNELSALFIVLSTFALHESWNRKGIVRYAFMSALVILIGISIATKAGALFSLLVVLLIPVANMRGNIFSIKSSMVLTLFVAVIGGLAWGFLSVIEETPFFVKFSHAFEKLDLVTLLLSGRDVHLAHFLASLRDADALLSFLFGPGADGLKNGQVLMFVEIDPVDIFMYFGWIVVTVFTALSLYIALRPIFVIRSNYFAPFLLLSNTALFFFAFIAGHVWTSGLLAIAWGVSISLLFVTQTSQKPVDEANLVSSKA